VSGEALEQFLKAESATICCSHKLGIVIEAVDVSEQSCRLHGLRQMISIGGEMIVRALSLEQDEEFCGDGPFALHDDDSASRFGSAANRLFDIELEPAALLFPPQRL
jgi:hypothetical protein